MASAVSNWPSKPNYWPEITRTDLDLSVDVSSLASANASMISRARPVALLIWIISFQTMCSDYSKIALFIDGANLHSTAKALGFEIDYKRLLKEFQSRGTVVRAFYYTIVIEDHEKVSVRPLIDWLDYNGYAVVMKATKEHFDTSGRRKVRSSMDIELTVNAMELAEHIDEMILFSGDGDFRALVEAMQRCGVRVTVVSTESSQPPMIADELRRQADLFTDLIELKPLIVRGLPS